jgi:hypothetical protein
MSNKFLTKKMCLTLQHITLWGLGGSTEKWHWLTQGGGGS